MQTDTSPAENGGPVTPSDTGSVKTRALVIGGAGDITVDFVGSGTNVTITGLLAGTVLPIAVKRVYLTGTTATNLFAIW